MLDQITPIIKQSAKQKRGRKAKPKAVRVSRKLELEYTRALLGIVNEMHAETKQELLLIIEQPTTISDSKAVADGLFDSFKQAFGKLSQSIKSKVSSIAGNLARLIVGRQKEVSDNQLVEMLQKQTGIDFSGLMQDEALQDAIDEAIAANVALINSIPQQYLDRVEQAVLASLQAGTLNSTLADDLTKIEGVTQNRARLIARDQLGKINSRLSQVRQQALGITHYRWSTSQDERVRGNPSGKYPKATYSHYKRHNMLFAWDSPPPDGHAGQAIACRCGAIPYTDHLTGGPTAEEAMKIQEQGG